jgi:hypothetical protein
MGEHRFCSTDLQNTNATKHGVGHPQTITFSYRHKCNYLVLLSSKESTTNCTHRIWHTEPGEPPTILQTAPSPIPYGLRRFVIGGAVLPLLSFVAIILKIAFRAAHHQRLSGNGFGSPGGFVCPHSRHRQHRFARTQRTDGLPAIDFRFRALKLRRLQRIEAALVIVVSQRRDCEVARRPHHSSLERACCSKPIRTAISSPPQTTSSLTHRFDGDWKRYAKDTVAWNNPFRTGSWH